MRIGTYNILKGGAGRLNYITGVLKSLDLDFVALQEANGFDKAGCKKLRELGTALDMAYYDIALGKSCIFQKFNVASLSEKKYEKVHEFKGFQNAGLATTIDSNIGPISICNLHLSPIAEKYRLSEIKKAIDYQSEYNHKIILGDLNSLSPNDQYSALSFNKSQIKKFSYNNVLRYDVVSKLLNSDYIDCGDYFGTNSINTVPTQSSNDKAHDTPLRIDYIFVSNSLKKYIESMEVVKTNLSEIASDHYPVVLNLSV